MRTRWPLHEAKNRFSEVVNKAAEEGPQTVTKYGKDAVVILDAQEYRKLTQQEHSLVDFFQNSPLADIQELELERVDDTPRRVDL